MCAGVVLVPGDAEAMAVLTPQCALLARPLDCQPAILFDSWPAETDPVMALQPLSCGKGQSPASLGVLQPERLHARHLPPIFDVVRAPQAGRNRLVADGTHVSAPRILTVTRDWNEWEWPRRLVGISFLGWAFVLAAVGWELFGLALSRCAGWGWDRGAFFFAWGLGIFAFGFYLRTSRRQPAASRLFLGVNILVVSVLSLVVATR